MAEGACTAALKLGPRNAKALYRRAWRAIALDALPRCGLCCGGSTCGCGWGAARHVPSGCTAHY